MRPGNTAAWVLATAMCVVGTGCRHKPVMVAAPPLPPMPPVELVAIPAPATGVIEETPIVAVPIAKRTLPRIKPRRKAPVEVVAAPAPVAPVVPVAPAPVNVVGSLTAGGDAAPGAKQQAADAIGAVEKRLSGLPAATADAQREGVARVRNFVRQAREALQTGDAEGAQTLATKARLLLDDLTK